MQKNGPSGLQAKKRSQNSRLYLKSHKNLSIDSPIKEFYMVPLGRSGSWIQNNVENLKNWAVSVYQVFAAGYETQKLKTENNFLLTGLITLSCTTNAVWISGTIICIFKGEVWVVCHTFEKLAQNVSLLKNKTRSLVKWWKKLVYRKKFVKWSYH